MTLSQWFFLILMAFGLVTLGVIGTLLWHRSASDRANAILSGVFVLMGVGLVVQNTLVATRVRDITEDVERRFSDRLACTTAIVEVLEIRSEALLTQKRKNVALGKSPEWLADLESVYAQNPLPQC